MILDEPTNGLDLDGIRWIRALLGKLAGEGKTVFLSSHLMSEMAVTADHVIVIGRGRLLRDQPMSEFIQEASADVVRVVTPETERLTQLLVQQGFTVSRSEAAESRTASFRVDDLDTPPALAVEGVTSRQVGTMAAEAGIPLWELAPQTGSLEAAYLALTRDSLDYDDTNQTGNLADATVAEQESVA